MPVIGIPVDMLNERIATKLEPDTMVTKLQQLASKGIYKHLGAVIVDQLVIREQDFQRLKPEEVMLRAPPLRHGYISSFSRITSTPPCIFPDQVRSGICPVLYILTKAFSRDRLW